MVFILDITSFHLFFSFIFSHFKSIQLRQGSAILLIQDFSASNWSAILLN